MAAYRKPMRQVLWAISLAMGMAAIALSARAMETAAREALLIDATTGATLFEKNADKPFPPASMSKIMTIYMVFDQLKSGKIKLEDTLEVTEDAWRRGGAASGGSTMFLKIGDRISIQDLIRGVIVQSGNDASMVLAEGLAGSEPAFAEQMTKKAKELGLTNSTFRNATGLPAPDHHMTARDLALLAVHTITDFPEYYPFYGEKTYVHGGITQGNRNPLLYKNIGADGLKTGHTQEAGYCLTASAKQGERRLVLVVTGLKSMAERSAEAERLISYGFREFDNYPLFKAGEAVAAADVWLGDEETVPLVTKSDALATLPRTARPNMKVTVVYDGPVPAPVTKGQPIGTLVITAPGAVTQEIPLVAGADVDRRGFFGRVFAAIGHQLGSIF